ncbi:MAG TPA: hypothetical protein VEH50_02045 [Methylomirabilota bacterium]|nr:hypothetical protein [Methylomirabilota bacterium]
MASHLQTSVVPEGGEALSGVPPASRRAPEQRLRVVLWATAALAGTLQAWASRFFIEPDGVNYLDVARAYLRGDLHAAVNSYWSPLYSWLLAVAIGLLHPSPYWESTVLHAVNLFDYLLSLACFAFFFQELTALVEARLSRQSERFRLGWAWVLFGYSLFVYASLELIGVRTDTPDLLVCAATLLATALLIRMLRGVASWRPYFWLGVVLAVGYLAKAVMFPLALVFILCSVFVGGNWRKRAPLAALALVMFGLAASPWLATLSKAEGRLTFGDSGRLSYAWYANDPAPSSWSGPEASKRSMTVHGLRILSLSPPVEAFASHLEGTYPPWYDPNYWSGPTHPRFEWRGQLRALEAGLAEYFRLLSAEKGIAVGLLALFLFSGRRRDLCRELGFVWPLWLPAVATLALYSLVLVESRYVGTAIVVLWCCLFAAIRMPQSDASQNVWMAVLLAVTLSIVVTLAAQFVGDISATAKRQDNVQWRVAQELMQLGVKEGSDVAILGKEKASDYWAHLAGDTVVADIPAEGVPDYWGADSDKRAEILNLLMQASATAIVTRFPPPASQAKDWQSLGSTGYYAIVLLRPGSN